VSRGGDSNDVPQQVGSVPSAALVTMACDPQTEQVSRAPTRAFSFSLTVLLNPT
jgi:hypothetical protein